MGFAKSEVVFNMRSVLVLFRGILMCWIYLMYFPQFGFLAFHIYREKRKSSFKLKEGKKKKRLDPETNTWSIQKNKLLKFGRISHSINTPLIYRFLWRDLSGTVLLLWISIASYILSACFRRDPPVPLWPGTKVWLALSESQVTKSSKRCALPWSTQWFVLYLS